MRIKIVALMLALVLFQLVGFSQKKTTPMTDDTIADQISIKLTGDLLVKGGGLKVEVKDGIATLTGSVDTAQQFARAGKVAGKVKGVKSVNNKIDVKARGSK